MSDEVLFAQRHFQDALKKINMETEPGLYSLAQGLHLVAQAIANLEIAVENVRRANRPPEL
jgi:hypothetical protein